MDIRDDLGEMPLHLACGEGTRPDPHLVSILLDTESGRANVNAVRNDGRTSLHMLCAVKYNRLFYKKSKEEYFNGCVIKCVEILLKHGAQVDISDKKGILPLHLACGEGTPISSPLLVSILLRKGAGVINAACRDGRTSLHILCAAKCNAGYLDNEGTEQLFDSKVTECVKVLLEHRAEVDVKDGKGNVPFDLANASGKRKVVELLQEYSSRMSD